MTPPGLAGFLDAIAPLLLGEEGVEQTRARLFPGRERCADAERLALLERSCRKHRHAVLEGVYPELRATVLRAGGEGRWAEVVEAYFGAHPMFCAELGANGVHLPGFLAAEGGALGLPPFAAALADLEWWEWRTATAPDDPADAAPEAGPLRIAGSVEARVYAWDLVGWLDRGEGARPDAPTARPVTVLFWRDRALVARRRDAGWQDLRALRAVQDGAPAAPAGTARSAWRHTLEALWAEGVLLGVLGAL